MKIRRPIALHKTADRLTFSVSRRFLATLFLLVCVGGVMMACDLGGSNAPNTQNTDQNNNNDARARLTKSNPYPQLKWSNELQNQIDRYNRLNDPNHISYVYIFAMDGTPMAEYQVKGKCSSTESQYSAPQTVVWNTSGQSPAGVTVPAPQPDGSYGQNEQAIFCFINDSQHTMIEFGDTGGAIWIWSDQRLSFPEQPKIVIVPNGK